MNQKAIQDFLNLPGVTGIALMDGQTRPYFHGVDSALNLQQREALSQGILQVIETTPEGFDSFEFQFSEHQVHIYKLPPSAILLVLTQHNLVYTDYFNRLTALKASFQGDIPSSVVMLRNLAKDALTTLNVSSQPGIVFQAARDTAQPPFAKDLDAKDLDNDNEPMPGDDEWLGLPSTTTVVLEGPAGLDGRVTLNTLDIDCTPLERTPPPVTVQNMLAALNHLSQFTRHYLGTSIIVNYWRSTCPDIDWLKNFQIDRAAEFAFNQAIPSSLNQPLTLEEQAWIKVWVAAFIRRCSTVIRNFPQIVLDQGLDPEQKILLWS